MIIAVITKYIPIDIDGVMKENVSDKSSSVHHYAMSSKPYAPN